MQPHVLEYEVIGSSGETLVLLPGGLTGWQSWQPLLPALSERHRVVNMQLHANAEGLAGSLGEASYTSDFERENVRLTLAAAGIDGSFHMIGWSNGGRAAIDYVIAHPQGVRSLTVVEPAAWWLLGDRDDVAGFECFIRRVAGTDLSSDDVTEFLWRAGLGPEGTDFSAMAGWPTWFACRNAMSWYGPAAIETAKAGITDLESVAVPVLAVRGTDTAPWLHDIVDVIAERMTKVRVVELPGGHASLLQNPQQFVAAVTEHVAGS